ncbi:MAG: hypothetical protein HQ511_04195 [Rhodospirillales bacterium]|nr:hypothetical protein [Rhodospirillales bacterium]
MIYETRFNGIPVRFSQSQMGSSAPFIVVDDFVDAIGPCLTGFTPDMQERVVRDSIPELVDAEDKERVIVEGENGVYHLLPTVSCYHVIAMLQGFAGLESHEDKDLRQIAEDTDEFCAWFVKEFSRAQVALGYSFDEFLDGLQSRNL